MAEGSKIQAGWDSDFPLSVGEKVRRGLRELNGHFAMLPL